MITEVSILPTRYEFTSGQLVIDHAEKNEVLKIKGWPDPAAWKKDGYEPKWPLASS